MRKMQQQMVLEVVDTLQEAHGEIEKYLETKQYTFALDILAQCQQGAIDLGGFLEETAGEGLEAVSLLEAYCEQVFFLYERIEKIEQEKNASSYPAGNDELIILDEEEKLNCSILQNQMLAVRNQIKNSIPIRKEVVFLPYKASMWDSLESVYLAAKEDPDCDAYCVPIPYFEKNPDGTLGKMHYEGNQYPDNIEVYSYLDYSLEERKPDVIYIHNPYDSWNHVTSVHPDYYSSKIRQYTDRLVYIPYFVLPEIKLEETEKIETMKHFCFLPGTIYADKVVLQSEDMRQIYIEEYKKAAEAYGLQGEHIDRAHLEQRFLGLGSPKYDKVACTTLDNIEIPDEWLKLIQKPDGSWKKIILYNTTIQAMLDNRDKMIAKIKRVLEEFKENQQEATLLWRPHPLLASTIKSMHPELWSDYNRIVEQYKKEGWGIYDDTADMDRAIAISNGYYGDMSSVLTIYQKTGKPVMVQCVDI